MTWRTRRWFIYGGLVLLIVLLTISVVAVGIVTRGGARNIRPGEDTTYITEPVDDAGMIDYVAAINRLASDGVSPDANAAVDLLRAFGPGALDAPLRSKYYAALRIPPLPTGGNYFVDLHPYAAQQATADGPTKDNGPSENNSDNDSANDSANDVTEQRDRCLSRKWTPDEYPLLDNWLRANEEPLRWIVRASHQPRCYLPLLPPNDSQLLMLFELPLISHQRAAVRSLCLRATRSWGAGQIDAALDDVLAALRLSRLASESPTLIDSLVAIACQRIVCVTLERIATSGDVSAEKLRDTITQIEQLPPMHPMWKKMEYGERYSYLSGAATAAREGVGILNDDAPDATPPWTLLSDLVDWNVVLVQGNQWYDKIVSAGKAADYQAHQEAVDRISKQMDGIVAQYRHVGRKLQSSATMTGRSQMMADVLVSLWLPALSAAYQAEFRDAMYLRTMVTSLWVAVFREEQSHYPESLEQLVPDYLAEIPTDLYDGRPIKYRRRGNGFVVYSIGPDQTDNGGVELVSSDSGWVGDLVVRVDAAPD